MDGKQFKPNFKAEALILAIALMGMAFVTRGGINAFINKERTVTVKGLSEREVQADKIIWPLTFKEIGSDPIVLHQNMKKKTQTIVDFLKGKGHITDEEISIMPPEIIDLKAERYTSHEATYRYNATSVITVTSHRVALVRDLMKEQAELLKQGIAITSGDYRYNVEYEFTGLNGIKPSMIEEATQNARITAEKFATDSQSKLGKIKNASQGQFSVTNRDANTPYIKRIRVVTTINYYLKN